MILHRKVFLGWAIKFISKSNSGSYYFSRLRWLISLLTWYRYWSSHRNFIIIYLNRSLCVIRSSHINCFIIFPNISSAQSACGSWKYIISVDLPFEYSKSRRKFFLFLFWKYSLMGIVSGVILIKWRLTIGN